MLAVVYYVNVKDIVALALMIFGIFLVVLVKAIDWWDRLPRKAPPEHDEVTCSEFLCLPEVNPSHYVNGRHRPIRGPS